MYRGILPPILVEAPKRAVKFAANEEYSKVYLKLFNQPKMTQPISVLTGVSAGITEAFLVVSFELVKIRMQDKNNVRPCSKKVDYVIPFK
jgi:solute carrier family 25 (mitochondrial 2-oxodicarboxylate transporter), member 21